MFAIDNLAFGAGGKGALKRRYSTSGSSASTTEVELCTHTIPANTLSSTNSVFIRAYTYSGSSNSDCIVKLRIVSGANTTDQTIHEVTIGDDGPNRNHSFILFQSPTSNTSLRQTYMLIYNPISGGFSSSQSNITTVANPFGSDLIISLRGNADTPHSTDTYYWIEIFY
jgi:hypothetical protein